MKNRIKKEILNNIKFIRSIKKRKKKKKDIKN